MHLQVCGRSSGYAQITRSVGWRFSGMVYVIGYKKKSKLYKSSCFDMPKFV